MIESKKKIDPDVVEEVEDVDIEIDMEDDYEVNVDNLQQISMPQNS
jgi:hypothetical protein